MLTAKEVNQLELKASEIRQDIIKMLLEAGSGHSAGSLGMADVFTALYFGGILKYNPQEVNWPERDRLVLSCGHICPVLYATLAHAGFFSHKELYTLRKINSRLQGHPHIGSLPGIEISSGPLGQGISQAVGMALAIRMEMERGNIENARPYVFCIVSDGEHNEGQLWEALLFSAKEKLGNLIVIVDRNNIQIDGFTEDVMPLEPLVEKYKAFGWHVLEINGHDFEQIITACNTAKVIFEQPTTIIAHTIPGKGVDFMEFDYHWHGKSPNIDQARRAISELRTLKGRIVSEHQ